VVVTRYFDHPATVVMCTAPVGKVTRDNRHACGNEYLVLDRQGEREMAETLLRIGIIVAFIGALLALPGKSQWHRIDLSKTPSGSLAFKADDIITTRSYWRAVLIPLCVVYTCGILVGALNW